MSSSFVVACLSLALVTVVLAFVREARLRRALQQLLSRLLTHWRTHHAPTRTAARESRNPSDGPVGPVLLAANVARHEAAGGNPGRSQRHGLNRHSPTRQ